MATLSDIAGCALLFLGAVLIVLSVFDPDAPRARDGILMIGVGLLLLGRR